MREYYFPSGIPVSAFDAAPWVRAIEVLYVVVLVAALGVFAWRCTRKASWWDVAGWVLLVAVELLIADTAHRYFLVVRDRHAVSAAWWISLSLTAVLALVAVNVTLLRMINHTGNNLGFLLVEFVFLVWLTLPDLGHPRELSYRTQCKNNLKQIGMAMHNFHDDHRAFPAASGTSPDGTELWSWRVALLPHVDAKPVFDVFHQDERWDSRHNLTLLPKRPPAYECPSRSTVDGHTAYALLRGTGTIGGDGVTPIPLKDITDGTSNTLFVVEACGRDIFWTEPKDVEVTDPSLGVNLPGDQPGRSRGIISSYHYGGGHVLFGDGSVRFISEKIDPAVLKALTTINGGETVPEF